MLPSQLPSAMEIRYSRAVMKTIRSTHMPNAVAPVHHLSTSTVLLFAGIAGLAVANLYYSQPMLAAIGDGVHASDQMLGLVPMLTQLGYALGILLLAPLGDRLDRRHIVIVKAAGLFVALLASALAPNIAVLLGASLVVGLTATLAQDIVSGAATLAPTNQRGKVVGTVMTGLLLGILLSRVVSGLVAERFGWRAMFVVAAATIAGVTVAAWRALPSIKTGTQLAYRALLASLASLWRHHPSLRRAAMAQALLAVGFSAFWSALALMLHAAPFHLGSAAAGAFGIVGAAGAIGAPLAGRLADRSGPGRVARLGTALAAVSFAAMLFTPLLSPHGQLWLIGASALGFDLGVQIALIAHQTIVYSLEPAARSRLNALLFVAVFVGMAAGAGLSSLLLAHWGWSAVVLLATVAAIGAFLLRLKVVPLAPPLVAAKSEPAFEVGS